MQEEEKDVRELVEYAEPTSRSISIYSDKDTMEYWQRVAKMMSSSDIVPQQYRGKIANTMVALEIAQRMGTSPLMIMQNLDIIQGEPSFSGQFIIAIIKASPRFINFRLVEEGDIEKEDPKSGYRALAESAETGETLKGTKITWAMVNGEGWVNRSGSKWKTMPEQMFKYRAATFWGREHCPDLLAGMMTSEERYDINEVQYEEINPNDARLIQLIETSGTLDELETYKDACVNEASQSAYIEKFNQINNEIKNQNKNGNHEQSNDRSADKGEGNGPGLSDETGSDKLF